MGGLRGAMALVRADLRMRWRSLVAMALLLGVGLGAAAGLAAGARRTDSAYRRMERAAHQYDVLINPDDGDADFAAVERLPQVTSASRIDGVLMFPPGADPATSPSVFGIRSATGSAGSPRPFIRRGRSYDPAAPDEVVASAKAARELGVDIGDVISLQVPPPSALEEVQAGRQPTDLGPVARLRLVGIGATPDNALVTDANLAPELFVGPGVLERYQPIRNFGASFVNLRPGASVGAFVRQAQELLKEATFFRTRTANEVAASQSVLPYVAALWAGATLLGTAVILIVGQAISRSTLAASSDDDALASLGLGRWARIGRHVVRAALVAVVAVAVAVAVVIAVSPRFPIGPARAVEPSPGTRVDGAALLIGAAASLLVALIVTAVSALVATRGKSRRPGRTSHAAAAASRAGLSPAAVTGIRSATQAGRDRLPVRTTIATAAMAVVAVVVAATFGASLDHLVATPRLYGGAWDLSVDFSASGSVLVEKTSADEFAGRVFAGLPVRAYSVVSHVPMVVAGHSTAGIAITTSGPYPSLTAGRPARARGEVVLGTVLARRIGSHVGSRVDVAGSGSGSKATVVGLGVFPRFSPYPGAEKTGLGEGAAVAPAEIEVIGSTAYPSLLLVALKPGANRTSVRKALDQRITTELDRLGVLHATAEDDVTWTTSPPPEPDGMTGYRDLGNLPLMFAVVLLLVAGGATAHVLVSSITQRRRELGTLRACGFDRGQVRRSVAWQASTTAVVAALIGLPLGIAAARWGWRAFGQRIGIVPEVAMPAWLVLVLPGVLLVANAVALLPARRVTRVSAAAALRAE